MKTGRINQALTGVWLGIALMNGASALNHEQERSKIEGMIEVLRELPESYFNTQYADELQVLEDYQESSRNRSLFLVYTDLGVAALNGIAGTMMVAGERKREQSILEMQHQADIIQARVETLGSGLSRRV